MWVNAYLVKGLERGDTEGDLIPDAHLELAVLAQVNGAKEALWRDADLTAKRWLDEHRADIAALLDSRESTYKTLREMAEEPSFVFLTKPKNRLVSPGVWNAQTEEIDYFERYDGRVLVGEDGKAPAKLNAWEDVVVQTEMKRSGAQAWYRNPSRPGFDALTAVYYDEATGRWRSVQPDFISFLRDSEDNMRASIVDTHGAYLGDALGKLRGLARYAEQYGEQFARIDWVSGAESVYERYGHAYK